MARYLVIKKEYDITVVREEAGEIVPLSFDDFIEELASPHYERYGVRYIDYWDIDDKDSDDIDSFERLWNFCGCSVDDFVRLFTYDSYDVVDLVEKGEKENEDLYDWSISV